jgi:hypothetical protein
MQKKQILINEDQNVLSSLSCGSPMFKQTLCPFGVINRKLIIADKSETMTRVTSKINIKTLVKIRAGLNGL